MIIALVLTAYAAVLAVLGSRVLTSLRWLDRAPNLAVAMWQAVPVSALLAAVLAASSVAVSTFEGAGPGVTGLLGACLRAITGHYGGVAQPMVATVGLAVASAVTGWTLGHLLVAFVSASRERRRHLVMLAPIARHDPRLDALVVEYDRPAAYCLPGRVHRVVVTSGAVDRLDDRSMAAVLAHERAHLSGRHHLVVTTAAALARAFGVVPLFRVAARQIAFLVELAADDAAARRHGHHEVAAALLSVGGAAMPRGALGAGSNAATRIRRLLAGRRPLGRVAQLAVATAVVGLLTLPLVVATNPAVAAALDQHCPLPV